VSSFPGRCTRAPAWPIAHWQNAAPPPAPQVSTRGRRTMPSALTRPAAPLQPDCSNAPRCAPKGVGVVTKVGPGVEGFAPGQRVTARPWRADKGDGSWQQYTTIPANLLVRV
jgi:hypothetical protein